MSSLSSDTEHNSCHEWNYIPGPYTISNEVTQNMGEAKSCGDPEQHVGLYINDPVADGK